MDKFGKIILLFLALIALSVAVTGDCSSAHGRAACDALGSGCKWSGGRTGGTCSSTSGGGSGGASGSGNDGRWGNKQSTLGSSQACASATTEASCPGAGTGCNWQKRRSGGFCAYNPVNN